MPRLRLEKIGTLLRKATSKLAEKRETKIAEKVFKHIDPYKIQRGMVGIEHKGGKRMLVYPSWKYYTGSVALEKIRKGQFQQGRHPFEVHFGIGYKKQVSSGIDRDSVYSLIKGSKKVKSFSDISDAFNWVYGIKRRKRKLK
jgi:hypothetical protein